MKDNEKICRFCLETVGNGNGEIIEQATKVMLDMLFPKVNLDISIDQVMCNKCTKSLQKAYAFKSTCTYTEDCIKSFTDSANPEKLNLQDIYLKLNKHEKLPDDFQDYKVCRVCIKSTKNDFCTSLNKLESSMGPIKNLLEEYIPELNLNAIADPIICKTCLDFLEDHLIFIEKYLDVEEKIKLYMEVEGFSEGVNLRNVQQFLETPLLRNEITCNDRNVDEMGKVWPKTVQDWAREDKVKTESFVEMDNLQTSIKNEADIKLEQNDYENISDTTFQMDHPKESEDINRRQNNKNVQKKSKVQCEQCSYATWNKMYYKRHLLVHKEVSETKTYRCKLCAFESKYKSSLNKHMLVHKNPSELTIFKCEICSYMAKRKINLNQHMLIHKNTPEIAIFKCELCTYETKYKIVLKRHLIVHKAMSELKKYECGLCEFKTKHKRSLDRHTLVHQTNSEMIVHKCEICEYKTKYKGCLLQHLQSHSNSSDIPLFKCDNCPYETKRQDAIKKHLMVHKIVIHQCKICDFETKYKKSFDQHMLVHENNSETETEKYHCDVREFEAGHKKDFTQHKLTHQSNSNKTVLKGETCPYPGKHIEELDRLKTHRGNSKLKMYQCEQCSFESKYKVSLNRHMLSHKSISEIAMYKCDKCTYESRYKGDLNRHLLTHRNSLKTSTYSCHTCRFKSKTKRTLINHLILHRGAPEVVMLKSEANQCDIICEKENSSEILLSHRNESEDLKPDISTILPSTC